MPVRRRARVSAAAIAVTVSCACALGSPEGLRYTSGQEGPRYTSGQEGPRYTSGQEGLRYTSGQEGPRYTSVQEGLRYTSVQEGLRYTSGQEGLRYTSGQEGPRYTSGQEGLRYTSGQEGLRYTSGRNTTVSLRGSVAQPFRAASQAASQSAPQAVTPSRRGSGQRRVQQLRRDLAAVFGARLMDRGVWAVDVRSLDSGEQLYDLNAGKLIMPASNMKILTLATVAETLGWDYTFTTTLETGGEISSGLLQGDLIVRSNGDPTINVRGGRATAVLDGWADALRAAGITAIDGRIVGDDQAFDDEGIGAGWSWDYLQYGYAAPVGALAFNESTATLTVAPAAAAGDPAAVGLTPGTGFILLNRALTGAVGSANTIDYRRHIDRAVLEVTGSVPAGSASAARVVAVVNPTLYFAQSLKDGLVARGITVSGDAADLDDVASQSQVQAPVDRRVLVTTASPPLREIGTVLMKVSQNLYAETLLKALGAAQGGLGTTDGGRTAARKTLSLWGVPDDAYVMYDGSGLSRYNYVTASTITTVLEKMYRDPRHKDAFSATLPIAGKDGTIESRLKGTRAEGNVVAKTGSIANVRSLSGFVHTRDGEPLVFSILTNDFVIPAATVNYMADVAVEVLANFTRR